MFTQLDEAQALHWLGAALVTKWQTIPHELQEELVQQALHMAQGDLDTRAQIEHFTKKARSSP